MTAVFADTSYYVALLSPRDQHHARAVEIGMQLRRPIVLTEFVLVELANAYASSPARSLLVDLWHDLRKDPNVTVVPMTSEAVARGFGLYSSRMDKQWSLTDCLSFEVMRDLGITEALTADQHFTQAGFGTLMV